MKKTDIKNGQIFEDWVVLSFDKELGPYGKFKYFLCKCICGNICSVRGYDLIKGSSKSCGCRNIKKITRKNLAGKTINNIYVIKEISHKLWEVKCSCEKIFNAKSSSLSGKKAIQSCGCKTIKIIKEKNSSNNSYLTYLYNYYKYNAVKRNLDFKISLSSFEKMIQSNCHYCGIEPLNIFDITSYNKKFQHNGIDRINNTLGYIEKNCVTCCKTCNLSKYTMTENDFYEWIKRIYSYLKDNKRI